VAVQNSIRTRLCPWNARCRWNSIERMTKVRPTLYRNY